MKAPPVWWANHATINGLIVRFLDPASPLRPPAVAIPGLDQHAVLAHGIADQQSAITLCAIVLQEHYPYETYHGEVTCLRCKAAIVAFAAAYRISWDFP